MYKRQPLNTPTADRRESGREGFMPTNKEPHDWARDDTSNRDGLWGGRFEDKTLSLIHIFFRERSRPIKPFPKPFPLIYFTTRGPKNIHPDNFAYRIRRFIRRMQPTNKP